MIQKTNRMCPYCGKEILGFHEKEWKYGSPIRICKRCRKKYLDLRYHEIAIDGSLDNEDDLCLHGHAIAYIGENKLEYDATISATALYLLKTLTEDHIINEDNQMLPCCGFFMIPDEKLENVTIIGCPNGIDWSVIHEDDSVRLILEDGTETIIPIDEYKQEVFRFADKIENFYMSCSPKKMPEDEYDRNGYITFWKEWHRRRDG